MLRKIIFTLIALGLIIGAFVKLAANKKEIDTAASYLEVKENIPVEVFIAKKSLYNEPLKFTGTLRPFKEVSFGAELQGKLTGVFVEEGQYVEAGQLLAKINDELLLVKLSAEKAQLEKATQDLERFTNLMKDNATTDLQLKQMELAYTLARSSVSSTQKQIDMTRILAPISGIVTMKSFEKGSIVAPGAPLGQITNVSQLKYEVLIPEKQVMLIQKGNTLTLTTEVYPSATFQAKVSLISVKGDQNHNYKVEALVANNNRSYPLKAGMFAHMESPTSAQTPVFLIPRTALSSADGGTHVFVARNGRAALASVVTEGFVGNDIAISQGLAEGDQVIVTGVSSLREGITIQIEPAK